MTNDPVEATQIGPFERPNTESWELRRTIRERRVHSLVHHLVQLAESVDVKSDSRAALAELRQAIKDPLRGAKHVVPQLGPEKCTDEEMAWFYRTASLFAMHRRHENGVSLGKAFRRCAENRDSDSIECRFLALLSASPDQLFDRLIGAITLLKADEVALDWYELLKSALDWGRSDKHWQHKIAGDYYRTTAATNASGGDDPANVVAAAAA